MISLNNFLTKQFILLLIFIFSGFVIFGQHRNTEFSIAYSGNNIWNPGAQLELNHPLSKLYKVNSEDHKKLITKAVGSEIGFFTDPNIYTLVYFSIGLNVRYEEKGIFWKQFNFHPVGLGRSFLPPTFEFSAENQVKEVKSPGRFYYSPSIQYKFGLNHNKKILQHLYAGVKLITLLPYNTYMLPIVNFQIGYRIN